MKTLAMENMSKHSGVENSKLSQLGPLESNRPVALITQMQRTCGNQAVQRFLRVNTPAVQRQDGIEADHQEENETPEELATPSLVVQEDFQPAEFEERPDDHMHIEMVGPGRMQEGEEDQSVHTDDENQVVAPAVGFTDLGRVGVAAYGDNPILARDHRPHAFTNGGRTATVVWAGGGGAGAHGNEGAGSVQAQTVPSYQSSPPPAAGGNAEAWVQAGTGTLDVTRSWVGINSGDQGNGHFVTAAAAARINLHETRHVTNSQGHYNATIALLLARVAAHAPTVNPKTAAPTPAAAIAALQAIINWPLSVTTFQTRDSADNAPGGTVDTNDVASGTYPVDAGPGTVAGTAFVHRVRVPTEPNPAP